MYFLFIFTTWLKFEDAKRVINWTDSAIRRKSKKYQQHLIKQFTEDTKNREWIQEFNRLNIINTCHLLELTSSHGERLSIGKQKTMWTNQVTKDDQQARDLIKKRVPAVSAQRMTG